MNKIKFLMIICLSFFFLVSCSNYDIDKECKNLHHKDQRHCYTSKAYQNSDVGICKKMPTNNDDRKKNKGYCLGFMASALSDLSICDKQPNSYYKRKCNDWAIWYYHEINEEFEDLKRKYDPEKYAETGYLYTTHLRWFCKKAQKDNVQECIQEIINSGKLNEFNFSLNICENISYGKGYQCVVNLVKNSDYKDYKNILLYCTQTENIYHIASHFCTDPLIEYYQTKDYVDKDWLSLFES